MAEPRYIGPFRVGELINNQYRVIRLLGEGGHAHVYECHDEVLDAVVAVKVIATTVGRGQELFKRAKAEAQVMFRLNHPNIVKVHSALVIDNSMLGIVMEKLEGLTLRMMLVALGQLTVLEALNLARRIAIGVGAAHKLNVVHRDIKPENVFVLPPDNSVKVLDFGIAKFIGHGHQTTNKHRLQGTPLYMSPEHLRFGQVSPRSDIYQLGTVLFELIAGVNPCLVGQEIQDPQQAALLQISRLAPPLSTLVRGVSPGLERLIQCAIAKDPSQRYDSMDRMVEAIDRAIEERLGSHPQEGQNIRYVDARMMQIAHERALRSDSDDISGPLSSNRRSQRMAPPREAASSNAASTGHVAEVQHSARGGEVPVAVEPRSAGVRPVLAPTVEVRPPSPYSAQSLAPATPSQVQATSLVAVSPLAPQRRLRQLSLWLVVIPILLGVTTGVGILWKWKAHDREVLAALPADSPSSRAVSAASDVLTLPHAMASTEASSAVPVASAPSASSIAGSRVTAVGDATLVVLPVRKKEKSATPQKPAKAQPRVGLPVTTLDTGKREPSHAPDDARARIRELKLTK